MVMEPMAEGSAGVREGVEREKFRSGIRGRVAGLGKRKRGDEEGSDVEGGKGDGQSRDDTAVGGEEKAAKKKRVKGPKGPNPLSVKKAKKVVEPKRSTDGEGRRATIPENKDLSRRQPRTSFQRMPRC